MKIALAQINTTVGDLDGNRDRIVRRITEARDAGAEPRRVPGARDHGLPPEDLLLRPAFVRAARRPADQVAQGGDGHRRARGRAARRGRPPLQRVPRVRRRRDERRLPQAASCRTTAFSTRSGTSSPGTDVGLLEHGEATLGLTVCEDLWHPDRRRWRARRAGAELLVNLSASPFHVGKDAEREEMFAARARDNGCALVFCNAVGGQDELVFDGNSFVLDAEGRSSRERPG